MLGTAWPAAAQEVDVARLPPAAEVTVGFDRDIRPIFASACYRCHSGDRPRSRYSLTDRESAVRGGAVGVAIIPGDSERSPLIHYVAGLVEGMEMPPSSRDEPLSPEQIALLRAWIDQGASYEGAGGEASVPSMRLVSSLSFQGFSVRGNEAKFRETVWRPDGFAGGVEDFEWEQRLEDDRKLTVAGRVLPGLEDYEIALAYERRDFGYVRGGYTQYRRWFDGVGGYYAPFGVGAYELDAGSLHIDTRRAWFEVGLDRPDLPEITVGYE